MTYTVYDKSAALGAPYELFRFTGPVGNYHYTNRSEPVTFEGDVYTPLQITRGVTELTVATNSPVTVNFVVPTNCPLFADHGRALSPPDLTVEVFRFHRGTSGYKRRIVGTVSGHNVRNEQYTIETKSAVQTELNRKVASVYYQTTCNHVLGDVRCGIDKSLFRVTSGIIAVSNTSITVIDDGFNDNALIGGEIAIGQETRVILDNVSNVLSLAYPFIDAAPGETATITRGCDLSRTTCDFIFSNIARFGGFPTIPTENPALPDLELVNTVTENRDRQDDPNSFWDISSAAG